MGGSGSTVRHPIQPTVPPRPTVRAKGSEEEKEKDRAAADQWDKDRLASKKDTAANKLKATATKTDTGTDTGEKAKKKKKKTKTILTSSRGAHLQDEDTQAATLLGQ